MIEVDEAVARIQSRLPHWGEQQVSLAQLSGSRVLDPLRADRPFPPYDRVMMDGIALVHARYAAGQRQFAVVATVAAGDPQMSLDDPATCIEVMTGAVLPQGADMVIPYEHLRLEQGYAHITHEMPRLPLANIHRQGSDCDKDTVVLAAGSRLNGPRWGIAAAVGQTQLRCLAQPRIQVISTGDELVEPDRDPLPHQVRRSNVYALRASLLLNGYASVTLSHVPDQPEAIVAHFQQAQTTADLLIYSGGVSQGKFDYLPQLWQQLGVEQVFHGVRQRPGKPLWFGVNPRTQMAVLGLPGNPVSSLVCLHRYFISVLAGSPPRYARLSEDIHFAPDLTYFAPVRVTHTPSAEVVAAPIRIQNSGELTALAESDGFVELPRQLSVFRQGECFRFFPWHCA
ncbi:MAG: molybdopterin molybdotransferase MoeA [Synechococcales cyanobacterium]